MGEKKTLGRLLLLYKRSRWVNRRRRIILQRTKHFKTPYTISHEIVGDLPTDNNPEFGKNNINTFIEYIARYYDISKTDDSAYGKNKNK